MSFRLARVSISLLSCALVGVVGSAGAEAAGQPTAAAGNVGVHVYFQIPAYGSIKPVGGYNVARNETRDVLIHWIRKEGAGARVWISMYDLAGFPTDAQKRAGRPYPEDGVDKVIDLLARKHDQLHLVVDQRAAGISFTPPRSGKGCALVPKSGLEPARSENTNSDGPHWTHVANRLWCLATDRGADGKDARSPLDRSGPKREYRNFHICEGACRGADGSPADVKRGIDHNKFVIIKPNAAHHSDGADSSVVIQESTNWTTDQFTDRFQSLTVVTNDAGLTSAYRHYWRLEYNFDQGLTEPDYGDATVAAAFDPRQAGEDTRLAALQSTRCVTDDAGRPSKIKTSVIRVTTNLLTNTRYQHQLSRMYNAGCHVRVVMQPPSSADVLHGLAGAKGDKKVPYECNDKIHSKDIVIIGYDKQGHHRHLTFTGSRPDGSGITHSDDTVLRLRGAAYADDFAKEFDTVWNTHYGRVSCTSNLPHHARAIRTGTAWRSAASS